MLHLDFIKAEDGLILSERRRGGGGGKKSKRQIFLVFAKKLDWMTCVHHNQKSSKHLYCISRRSLAS